MSRFCLIFGLLLSFTGKAQQLPLFFHHFQKPFLVNPSRAGEQGEAEVFLALNRQWQALESAPETAFLTIDAPIYQGKMGLGLALYNDRMAILSRSGGSLTYAYRVPFGDRHSLRLGLSLNYEAFRLDTDRIIAVDWDDEVLQAYNNQGYFDGNFGLTYQFREIKIAFSALQMLKNSLVYRQQPVKEDLFFRLIRHYYLTAQWSKQVNQKWRFEPYLFLQSAQGLPLQYQLLALAKMKEKWWFGLSYRGNVGTGIVAGLLLDQKVRLSYAFELPLQEARMTTFGSHELTLSLRLPDLFKKAVPPKKKPSKKPRPKRTQQQIALLLGNLQQTSLNGKPSHFFIILAAFNEEEQAKAYQKELKKTVRVRTSILESAPKEGETFFLLYTQRFNSWSKAQRHLASWHAKDFKGMVPGKPWIYHKKRRGYEE